MNKKPRRTIWQWLRDWWTPDDHEDADGYPGDVCPMCEGGGLSYEEIPNTELVRLKICPACKGKGTV